MATYFSRDILSSSLKLSNNKLDNFVYEVRKNLTKEQRINLSLIEDKPFCLMIGNKIALTRYAIESLIDIDSRKELGSAQLEKLIKDLVTNKSFLKKDYQNFNEYKFANKTTLKQDFVCYVIWYIFRNTNATIQDLHYHLQTLKNVSADKKLKISSTISNFIKATENINYSFIVDAYSVAKTIIHNKTIMHMSGNLEDYYIGEETSSQQFKKIPFDKIKKKIDSYYNNADVLMKADIFLWIENDEFSEYMKKLNALDSEELENPHEEYRFTINSALRKGLIIPISLKKLEESDVGTNFITNKFKVIGSNQTLGRGTQELQDPYMRTIEYLFSLDSRSEFVKALEKIIDIDYESGKIPISVNPNTISIDFTAKFVNPISSVAKANLKNPTLLSPKKYTISLQAGSMRITPEGSTSISGLGSMTTITLENSFIKSLPTYRYKRDLIKNRIAAFESTFPGKPIDEVLKKERFIKTLEYKTFFSNSRFNTSGKKESFVGIYISNLFKNSKVKYRSRNANDFIFDVLSLCRSNEELSSRLSRIEFLYLITCNENLVKEYVKKSFIMSAYSIISGVGKILIYRKGKYYNLKGREAIKTNNLLNPIYYKLGE